MNKYCSTRHALLVAFVFVLVQQAMVVETADATEEWFQILDSNHDGFLDKSEYKDGVSKLQSFLRQPLLEKASVGGTSILDMFSFFKGSGSEGASAFNLIGFWKAFTSAVCMIIATEIGDKTFFIAAILSMKHSRLAVFAGAILALVAMTILSTAMGLVLPNFLARQYTHILSGILFLYFGFKLIYDARQMEAGHVSDELEEVEEELLRDKKEEDEEKGGQSGDSSSKFGNKSMNNNKKAAYQIALQSFTLTFLAEWGDRSQIATIALAAAKNPIGVTVGGCLGHFLCTGVAVLGGRMLAARIEEKTVHQFGGVVFLLFGIHSMFFEE